MVQNDYEEFLAYLSTLRVSDDVIRLANIIHKHIDTLIPLGTGHSQRARKLSTIARRELDTTSNTLSGTSSATDDTDYPINSLVSLAVGPFSGFTEEETFDLDSAIVLVYGPNGSGKSSFCEAFEYALLGAVEEAEAKRLDAIEYLANARVRAFRQPTLLGKDGDGNTIEVVADEEMYRFCFIEKNRIDDFSRIAAKPPAQQDRLIATLFGLAPFDEFIKGFNIELNFLDLIGESRTRLNQKRVLLHSDEEVVVNEKETMEELTKQDQALSNKINEGMN